MNLSKRYLSSAQILTIGNLGADSWRGFFNARVESLNSMVQRIISLRTITFKNTFLPLESAWSRIDAIYNYIYSLKYIKGLEFRNLEKDCQVEMQKIARQLNENRKLNIRIKKLKSLPLSEIQKKAIDNAYWLTECSWESLKVRRRREFLEDKSTRLSYEFDEKLKSSLEDQRLYVPWPTFGVDELPFYLINNAERRAEELNYPGHIFVPTEEEYYDFMTFCPNRELRHKMYKLKASAASELSNNSEYNAKAIIQQILDLRKKEAKLSGHSSYAHYVLMENLIGTPRLAEKFLLDLAKKLRPKAIDQKRQLSKFLKEKYNIKQIQPWDYRFAKRQLIGQFHEDAENVLKQSFELLGTIDRTLNYFASLVSIDVVKERSNSKELIVYRLSQKGKCIGRIAFVPYCNDKNNDSDAAAFCVDILNRTHKGGALSIVFLQLQKADGRKYLTYNEFHTFLHELGHAFQNLCSKPKYSTLSLNNLESDAFEIHSKVFEKFAYKKEFVREIARFRGHKVSLDLIEKKIKKELMHIEAYLLSHVIGALADIRIHYKFNPRSKSKSPHEILNLIRQQIGIDKPKPYNRHIHHSRSFSGTYACLDYCYVLDDGIANIIHEKMTDVNGNINSEGFIKYVKDFIEPAANMNAKDILKGYSNEKINPDWDLKGLSQDE